jgi:hypothetical protein
MVEDDMSIRFELNDDEHAAVKEYKLTPLEARAFVALRSAGGLCPSPVIHPDRNTRGVVICTLRKKISPHGFEINNMFGKGYLLEVRA